MTVFGSFTWIQWPMAPAKRVLVVASGSRGALVGGGRLCLAPGGSQEVAVE